MSNAVVDFNHLEGHTATFMVALDPTKLDLISSSIVDTRPFVVDGYKLVFRLQTTRFAANPTKDSFTAKVVCLSRPVDRGLLRVVTFTLEILSPCGPDSDPVRARTLKDQWLTACCTHRHFLMLKDFVSHPNAFINVDSNICFRFSLVTTRGFPSAKRKLDTTEADGRLEFLRDDNLADITFTFPDDPHADELPPLKAHLGALGLISTYFRACMRHVPDTRVLTIRDATRVGFQKLLERAYHGFSDEEAPDTDREGRVMHETGLLAIAHRYGFSVAYREIAAHITTNMGPETCLTVLNAADDLDRTELFDHALSYCEQHFVELSDTPEMKAIFREKPGVALKLAAALSKAASKGRS